MLFPFQRDIVAWSLRKGRSAIFAEFLGALTRTEMLSTFFVHDGGDTSKWRVKKHAQRDFSKWVCGH